MISIHVSVDVARPAESVFAWISDFSKNPTWQKGMTSCVWLTDPPLRVGSRYDQKASFMGKEIVSTFEVLELEPGKRVKAHSIAGSFPITFTRSVEPLGADRTRVSALIEGDSTGFFRLAEPLMKIMVRKSIHADYDRLRDLLEHEDAVEG